MPLKAVVDKIDDVAEGLREYYTEGADGKFHLSAEGVEDVSGLKSALQKERRAREDAEKAAKETSKQWEGLDPTEVRDLLGRIEGDEDMKLIKEGKHDQVFNKRTEKLRNEHQKQLEKLQADHKTQLDEAIKRTQLYEGRVLENELRQAAAEVGLHSPAIRDAVREGRSVFTLDDNGKAVQKREDGSIVIGKDGKSPFSPREWLESMRPEAPHWFPAAGSGTGASQSKGTNGSGAKTMTRSAFAKLSAAQQHTFIRKEGGTLVDD